MDNMIDQYTHPAEQISFIKSNMAYVVEASAGTGKTWTIERLYIKALLEGINPIATDVPLSVENILVVTFTEDATSELKERLYTQIEKTINLMIYLHTNPDYISNEIFTNYLIKRHKSYDYKKDVMLLTRALQNFDQAAIFTIHGFCNKVLHDYQFECQVNPEFETVKDKTDILKQMVLNFLRSQILNNPIFQNSLNTVSTNLIKMFNVDITTTIEESIVGSLPRDLFKISQNKYYIKYQINVPKRIDFLIEEGLEINEIHKSEFLAYLIDYIYQQYPSLCKNSKNLSYDEMIQVVADAIKNSNGLAEKIYAKYPIAFIDEFQDTDLLQWQIFSGIYHLSSKEFTKRGNVVVVGDPKQAIYRFRGADVDTYIEARNEIGCTLDLISNYRSHPNIMNFINQLFNLSNQSSVISNSYLGDGIDYHQIWAKKSESKNIIPTANELKEILDKHQIDAKCYDEEVQIVTIHGESKRIRTERLLRSMTFEILALLNAKPELKGKIAVLVTKNREATELVKYFANFGIKATELKLGNIFGTTTANDLYNILTSLTDLSNRQNFIKAVTTKIFNVSLISLTNIDDNPQLEILSQRFSKYKETWESFGIFSLIYLILEDITKDGNILSNRELANLWQLSELLNKHSKKINNQIELLFWFKERILSAEHSQTDNVEVAEEELIRLDNDDEQIVITTQHKSKGLEYEVLFCPYFKSNITLDGSFDFNYKRPFFSNYRKDGAINSEMVLDKKLGQYIVDNDNKEIHRLNYVALTRAKSRIYLYLKQNTIVKKTGKYHSSEKPDKLAELFGYVKSNPQDTLHKLFNYSNFFSDNPELAIKDHSLFPGVVVYHRSYINDFDLLKLKLPLQSPDMLFASLAKVRSDLAISNGYTRQSYTGLTKVENFEKGYDYYEKVTVEVPVVINYRYTILNDKSLSGAVFGTLFHELCEIYPFTEIQLEEVLYKYNISEDIYKKELKQMIEEAFSYPLIDSKGLSNFSDIVHELEFNLTVNKNIQIGQLIASYFGVNHPFSLACGAIGEVKSGFLVGFMDVCFKHDDKYWVLDYKTNSLTNYTGAKSINDVHNQIVESMAEHHYYLQYLLYLVALKRYLENRLRVVDASHLIGGAIYYYVRGIYTENAKADDGIFVDNKCQELVGKIDKLLKGQLY